MSPDLSRITTWVRQVALIKHHQSEVRNLPSQPPLVFSELLSDGRDD